MAHEKEPGHDDDPPTRRDKGRDPISGLTASTIETRQPWSATDGRRTLNIHQAMAHVGVSRRTIYHWLAAGKLQYVRTAGGAVRIFEDSLWRPRGG